MRFWDASAIVPLLVAEPATRRLQALAMRDPVAATRRDRPAHGAQIDRPSAVGRRPSRAHRGAAAPKQREQIIEHVCFPAPGLAPNLGRQILGVVIGARPRAFNRERPISTQFGENGRGGPNLCAGPDDELAVFGDDG